MGEEAIYGLSVVPLSRSKAGGSPVAKMAYRRGAIERDNAGVLHDYSRKGRNTVRESWQMLPADAPAWAHDAGEMWRRVDRIEKRKDARFARDFQITLPRQLTRAQQRAAINQFCGGLIDMGMVGTVGIHDYGEAVGKDKNPEEWAALSSMIEARQLPAYSRSEIAAMQKAGDPRLEADHAVIERGGALRRYQPHAHIMMSERRLDAAGPEGFAKVKDRSWNDKAKVIGWRQDWERIENQALEAAGSALRADHRSRKARGLDGAPEPKLGHCPSHQRRQEYQAAREIRRLFYERRQIDRAIAAIEKGMKAAPGCAMAEKSQQAAPEKFVPQWALKTIFADTPIKWARRDDDQVIFKIGNERDDRRRIFDRGDHLTTNRLDRDTTGALVKLARAKGWTRVDLTGTEAQQIALARELAAAGIAIGKAESEAVRLAWQNTRRAAAEDEKGAQIQRLEKELAWLSAQRREVTPEKKAKALEIVRDIAICPPNAPTIHQLRRRRDDLEKTWQTAQAANSALAEAEGKPLVWRLMHGGKIADLRQQATDAYAAWTKVEPKWQAAEKAVLGREKAIAASKVKIDDRIGEVTDALAELVPDRYESPANAEARRDIERRDREEERKAQAEEIEKAQRALLQQRLRTIRQDQDTEARTAEQKPRYSAEVEKVMRGPSPFD
jgi:hypothetical protein